jgi:hypothetical protein
MFVSKWVLVIFGAACLFNLFFVMKTHISLYRLIKQINRFVKREKIIALEIKIAGLEERINFLVKSGLMKDEDVKEMENAARAKAEEVTEEIEGEPDYF